MRAARDVLERVPDHSPPRQPLVPRHDRGQVRYADESLLHPRRQHRLRAPVGSHPDSRVHQRPCHPCPRRPPKRMDVIGAEQAGVVHDQRQARTSSPRRAGNWNEDMDRAFRARAAVRETLEAIQRRGGETGQGASGTCPQRGDPQGLELGERAGLCDHDSPARLLPPARADPPAQRVTGQVLHRGVDAQHTIMAAQHVGQFRRSIALVRHAASLPRKALPRERRPRPCG
jgi:hypothetical protein